MTLETLHTQLMNHGPVMAAGIYCFLGAIVPMLNTELFIAFLGGMTVHDPLTVCMVALSASVGRMIGTTLIYFSVMEGVSLGFKKTSMLQTKLQKWHNTIEKMPHIRVYLLTFIGSAVGVPPMYLFTMVLAALKIEWRAHFFIGILGSIIKYALFFVMGAELVKTLHLF